MICRINANRLAIPPYVFICAVQDAWIRTLRQHCLPDLALGIKLLNEVLSRFLRIGS